MTRCSAGAFLPSGSAGDGAASPERREMGTPTRGVPASPTPKIPAARLLRTPPGGHACTHVQALLSLLDRALEYAAPVARPCRVAGIRPRRRRGARRDRLKAASER